MTGVNIFLLVVTRIFWEGKCVPSLVRIEIEKVRPLNADEVV
jgi:hypothetical protein